MECEALMAKSRAPSTSYGLHVLGFKSRPRNQHNRPPREGALRASEINIKLQSRMVAQPIVPQALEVFAAADDKFSGAEGVVETTPGSALSPPDEPTEILSRVTVQLTVGVEQAARSAFHDRPFRRVPPSSVAPFKA